MSRRFIALLLAGLLALAGTAIGASPASADVKTCKSASWGAACVDIDTIAGNQYLYYEVDDQGAADGYCVYFYVRRLADSFYQYVTRSCGPVASGSTSNVFGIFGGPISGTVRITRGPYPGANYFTITTSVV